MRPFRARATMPTAAERVLSIMSAAHSMTVVSDGLATEVRRLDGAGAMGHIHLHAPAEDAGTGTGTHGDAMRVPVRLEFTDIAPTPVRDRLRARVTVTGLLLTPYDATSEKSTCMEFGQAVLEDAGHRAFIPLHTLAATELDPLATREADMLTHLMDEHSELLPLLLRLVRPLPRKGMTRALPVAMDRYGVTLRLEYPHTHRDVRLPFKAPVTDIDQAGPRIHALLATAGAAPAS
ncbi:DUF2470 domain-containing protein [Streptomyces sp. NPDC000151]|uniref:DUF2470 domain-containing protein n=1 Tax=Streptomyces sp. NPDC000151 TaxID=3154244 RepID=UPI00332B97A4